MPTSVDALREVADDVAAARRDWSVDEIRTALTRVLARDPDIEPDELRRGALAIVASSTATTPWVLTGIGGTYSSHVDRPVEPPPMRPQPRPIREVIEPDPYRGDEAARAESYARGATAAREALARAGLDRVTREAAREAERAAERAERRATDARMAELSAAARDDELGIVDAESREVVDW